MKRTLTLLIASVFIIGCGNNNPVIYDCTKGTIKILNKERSACARGGGWCHHSFYLFDGKEAYTCRTDEATWNSYNVNDTLPTLVITKTITFKK